MGPGRDGIVSDGVVGTDQIISARVHVRRPKVCIAEQPASFGTVQIPRVYMPEI